MRETKAGSGRYAPSHGIAAEHQLYLLEGFRGGYAVDGLDIVEEAQTEYDTHS